MDHQIGERDDDGVSLWTTPVLRRASLEDTAYAIEGSNSDRTVANTARTPSGAT
jgi:hypothetical protein